MSARSMGIPAWLHESNAIPGKVTRFLAPRVSGVMLGLEACARHLPSVRTRVTGTPVRMDVARGGSAAEARARLGLDASCDTVLIMGGSQGARGLNDAVMRGFPAWADAAGRVQFLHLAGALDAERVGRAYGECGLKARVMDFCDDMPAAYAASQVCVARSGASSLTELALCALPAVLVPLPTSAEDHQRRNADVYAAAGAALIAEQSACPGDELGRMVRGLLGDAERRGAMSAAMHALAAPDAAARVADVVEGRS
jgi:UDP-N-acetylglucosamine--N-acetylmuramyl-(pentapeptide) pyrophosphoryl-undecaprenol N-acetylglucosamine transferase